VKGQQLMDLKPPGFAWLCLVSLGFVNDTLPVYLGD